MKDKEKPQQYRGEMGIIPPSFLMQIQFPLNNEWSLRRF
jgi:hypothetical protein